MNKKVIITISAIVILSVVSIFLYQNVNQSEGENIQDETNSDVKQVDNITDSNSKDEDEFPIIKKMNEPLVIKSRQYKQGEQRVEDYGMNMGWNGDMEITVTSAKVYDTPEDAGISESDLPMKKEFYTSKIDSPKFVLIDTTINNISSEYLWGIKYEFHARMFSLLFLDDFSKKNYNDSDYFSKAQDNILQELYFSHHLKNTETKYYHFNLPKGEKIDAKLGFWVNEKYIKKNELVLNISKQTWYTT